MFARLRASAETTSDIQMCSLLAIQLYLLLLTYRCSSSAIVKSFLYSHEYRLVSDANNYCGSTRNLIRR